MSAGPVVFVTAPRGILGAQLVRTLLARGAREVRCGVRDPSEASDLESLGCVPTRFDLHDPSTFRAATDGAQCVVIVPPVQVEDLAAAMRPLVSAACDGGCRSFVRISLSGASSGASFEWGRLHAAADAALAAAAAEAPQGTGWCVLASAPLMQSFALLHRWSIDAQGAIYAPLGDGKVAFVDAGDVAQAAAEAALRLARDPAGACAGRTIVVTGPEAVGGEEIARAMGDALGRDGTYRNVTETAARHGMTGAGWPEYLVDRMEGLHGAYRRGEFTKVSDEPEKLLGMPHPRNIRVFFKDLLSPE